MEITSLKPSENKSSLVLEITDAADATILRLWTDKTYKNFAEVKDFSAKLTNAATQNITITLSELGEPYLDGVYFVEAKDTDETSIAMTAELSRFKECIMDKLLEIATCDECLSNENRALMNAHTSLITLEHAVAIQFPDEAITIKRALDRFCNNSCRSCGTYQNIQTTASKDTLNPDTVIVTLDGGSLD